MNYQHHYDKLVETRRNRVLDPNIYYEKHHIIMRSMGGSDDPGNIVTLTAREHFLAHWLLWRIHRNRATACAFHFMCWSDKNVVKSSRLYAEAREAHNISILGKGNGRYGKETTKETREKIREKRLGTRATDETRLKLSRMRQGEGNSMFNTSAYNQWIKKYGIEIANQKRLTHKLRLGMVHKGKPKSDETKQKMAEAKRGHVVSEETKEKIRQTMRKKRS